MPSPAGRCCLRFHAAPWHRRVARRKVATHPLAALAGAVHFSVLFLVHWSPKGRLRLATLQRSPLVPIRVHGNEDNINRTSLRLRTYGVSMSLEPFHH